MKSSIFLSNLGTDILFFNETKDSNNDITKKQIEHSSKEEGVNRKVSRDNFFHVS